LTKSRSDNSPESWLKYYRWTSKRPPRELLTRTLDHIEWEGRANGRKLAVEIGFGAGNDTLELLRRGWTVLAVDAQEVAAKYLARRVPPRHRGRLTTLVCSMEALEVPPADLVYASFSLPFCQPERFGDLWSSIRSSVRTHGHFAGNLFGDRDEYRGKRPMSFFSRRQVLALARGMKVELLRETDEQGRTMEGPKRWHFFDLLLEQRGRSRPDR
jgi:tellurite methyltransferase